MTVEKLNRELDSALLRMDRAAGYPNIVRLWNDEIKPMLELIKFYTNEEKKREEDKKQLKKMGANIGGKDL
jgi:hypothetical protein